MELALYLEADVFLASRRIPYFLRDWKFSTMTTTARHRSFFRAKWIHSSLPVIRISNLYKMNCHLYYNQRYGNLIRQAFPGLQNSFVDSLRFCLCLTHFFLVRPTLHIHFRCTGLLLHLITFNDTNTHSVWLPWRSDQPVTDTSTRQYTIPARDRYPWCRRYSNK